VYQLNRTPRESFKQLCIIYIFFLLGILLFTGFVIFFVVIHDGGLFTTRFKGYEIVKWIFAVAVLALLAANVYSYRKRIENLDRSLPLDNKLIIYRNSYIVKIIGISFICMSIAVILLFYGQLNLIIPLVLFILYFLLIRPHTARISDELYLSPGEHEELRQ